MKQNTVRRLAPLTVFFFLAACRTPAPAPTAAPALQPSPNLIVGRVLAIDSSRQLAIVGLVSTLPAATLPVERELIARTDILQETAHLRITHQLRGRTLGTLIVSGSPSIGDEVILPGVSAAP